MILTALAMAFITTLVVANIIAIKLFSFSVPIIPDDWLIDNVWVLPVSSFTYPITFLITDTIAELYGRRATTRIVWIGFGCSILMLAMIYFGKIIPGADFWVADGGQDHYDFILGSVPRIVAGSMVAYLISQNFDVFAFHFWREKDRRTPPVVQEQRLYDDVPRHRHGPVHHNRVRRNRAGQRAGDDAHRTVSRKGLPGRSGHPHRVRPDSRNTQIRG